jgi:hypothetical protein
MLSEAALPSQRGSWLSMTHSDTREAERRIAREESIGNPVLILALDITIMQRISEEG